MALNEGEVGMYLRQSKDVQDDRLAVSRQREDCLRSASGRGWPKPVEYQDNDTSASRRRGKKLKLRTDFEQVLVDMESGKLKAILVGDPDRLLREPVEGERFIEVADEHGVVLASPGGDFDLTSDGGRLQFRIKVAFSKAEMERKSARQCRANLQRRDRGVWSTAGLRPFGYGNGPSVKPDDKKVGFAGQPYEPEAALLRKAATDVLGKRSLRSIAIEWNTNGVTTTRGNAWTNLQLRRLLSNPLYAGLVTHQGKVVGRSAPVDEGGWEPLLEENIHLGLVAFLNDPARKSNGTFEIKHQGSGVYFCSACGGRLYAGYPSRGGGYRGRMTYICKRGHAPKESGHRHVARIGWDLDEFVTNAVVDRLRTRLIEGDEGHVSFDLDEDDGIDVITVTARLTALRERLDDMAEQRALGEIDRQQLARATATLKPQMDALQAVLDSQKVKDVETDPVDEITKDGPEGVLPNWAKASPDIRSKVIDKLMTVTVLPTPRGTKVFDEQYVNVEWKSRRPVATASV